MSNDHVINICSILKGFFQFMYIGQEEKSAKTRKRKRDPSFSTLIRRLDCIAEGKKKQPCCSLILEGYIIRTIVKGTLLIYTFLHDATLFYSYY